MPAREVFDIESEASAQQRSRRPTNPDLNKQIGGVAVVLLCIIGLVCYFSGVFSGSSGSEGMGALKIMNLNANTYQTMCTHGVPDSMVVKDANGEYEVSGTCPAAGEGDCAEEEIAKQCCGVHHMHDGEPKHLCGKTERAGDLEGCDKHGEKGFPEGLPGGHFPEGVSRSEAGGHFPHYVSARELDLKEPLCRQGARKQLENIVLQSKADVIAVQEDLEYTPLTVRGYVTIISPNSHNAGFVPDGGNAHNDMVDLTDSKAVEVHTVNTLLVRKELLDETSTRALCSRANWVNGVDDWNTVGAGIMTCGMTISTNEWEKLRNEIIAGKLNVQDHSPTDDHAKSTRKVAEKGEERIVIAAKRVAALAVIKFNGQEIAIASAKLSGGEFDDQLMMGDFAEQIKDAEYPSGEAEKLRTAPQLEKNRQVENMKKHLDSNGMKGKNLIMGDFGGPDDFVYWWRNALFATNGKTALHPALASFFDRQCLITAMGKYFNLEEENVAKRPLLYVERTSAVLRHCVRPKPGDEGKDKDKEVKDKEAEEIISKLHKFLEPYWTGAHEALEKRGQMHKLYKVSDFEHFAEPLRGTSQVKVFNEEGHATSVGNVADYIYASEELLQAVAKESEKIEKTDDTTELEIVSHLQAKDKKVPKGGFASYKAWLVPEVLGKITDHAPVVVCLALNGAASLEHCTPPGPLYPEATEKKETVAETAGTELQEDKKKEATKLEHETEAVEVDAATVAKDVKELDELKEKQKKQEKQVQKGAERVQAAALKGKSAEAKEEATKEEKAKLFLEDTRDNIKSLFSKLTKDKTKEKHDENTLEQTKAELEIDEDEPTDKDREEAAKEAAKAAAEAKEAAEVNANKKKKKKGARRYSPMN